MKYAFLDGRAQNFGMLVLLIKYNSAGSLLQFDYVSNDHELGKMNYVKIGGELSGILLE